MRLWLALVTGLIPARAGNTPGLAVHFVGEGAHPRSRGEHGNELVGGVPNRAHPRSRGEHDQRLGMEHWRKGSSPLARGTLKELSLIVGTSGLIPARAGNTRPLQ